MLLQMMLHPLRLESDETTQMTGTDRTTPYRHSHLKLLFLTFYSHATLMLI